MIRKIQLPRLISSLMVIFCDFILRFLVFKKLYLIEEGLVEYNNFTKLTLCKQARLQKEAFERWLVFIIFFALKSDSSGCVRFIISDKAKPKEEKRVRSFVWR